MAVANFARYAGAFALCSLLAGCGTVNEAGLSLGDGAYPHASRAASPAFPAEDPNLFPDDNSDSTPLRMAGGLQCVPYARAHSNVDIHGDAYTWWDKAAGQYERGTSPMQGAVMVMDGYAGKHRAHVAVVRQLVSPREIRIDHANWLNDRAIYVNDPVIDVSPDNDWSAVKIWNIRAGTWGSKVYAVRGFIGPGPVDGNPVVSSNEAVPSDPIARQIAAYGADAAFPAAPTLILHRAGTVR